MFSAAVCKIQASKCYIESLQLVPNNKRSWFSQSERSAVQLPLDHVFAPEVASLKVKGPLYSYLLIMCLPQKLLLSK